MQNLRKVTEDSAQVTLGLPLDLKVYAVADVPAAASNTGNLIYCSNGDAGDPCLAVSNGTSWLRIALGIAVAAS